MIINFDESTVVKEYKYDTFGNVISEGFNPKNKQIISKLENMGAKNLSVYLLTPKSWIKKMNKNGESIIGKLEDCECEEN